MAGLSAVRKLTDNYWTWRLQQCPEFATVIGCHDYDDQLDLHSIEVFQSRKRDCEAFLEQVNYFLDTSISDEDWINLIILKKELEMYISGVNYKGFYFPISSYEDILRNFEKTVKSMDFNSDKDYYNLISRFQQFPTKIEGIITVLRQGIREGRTQHHYAVKNIMHNITKFIELEPKDTSFYKPFQKLKNLLNVDLDRTRELEETGVQLIKTHVQDIIKKFIQFLKEEYFPNLRPSMGLSSIPDGQDCYDAVLKFHTNSDLTPMEIHVIGIQEVNRIRRKMDKEDLLASYHDVLTTIRKELPKYFKNIPNVELRIENDVKSKADSRPTAFYDPPSMDGSKPGIVQINSFMPQDRPKYEMMTLLLHEAEPGHHLQFSHCIGLNNLPAFRRFKDDRYYACIPSSFPMHSAYIEGWGMYSEHLGEEMGLYKDPYSRFGRYCMEIERACRLVVDTGIHAFGWKLEDTVRYMKENTPISDDTAHRYIERFARVPGQACSYTIGRIKITELRQKAEDELGGNFDIKDFHDAVLSCGPVPLTVLELLIDKFIENKLSTVTTNG
ncbi:uncharacterized protein LOC144448352 isoform X3 [Glandiceps talaboti]